MNIVSNRFRRLSGTGSTPKLTATVTVVFMILFGLSACGQKGDLIVEKPPEELVTTQQEEAEETK